MSRLQKVMTKELSRDILKHTKKPRIEKNTDQHMNKEKKEKNIKGNGRGGKMQIKELIEKAHRNACEKGFYECPKCYGTGRECDNGIDCDKVDLKSKNDLSMCAEYCGNSCVECNGTGKANKNIGELLMLVVSELGEALEAHRKSRFCSKDRIIFYDENIETMIKNDSEIAYFSNFIKDTFEDELADVCIRLLDMCGYLKITPVDFPHGVTLSENVGESLLEITHLVCNFQENNNHSWRNESMFEILHYIQCLCRDLNIDLEKHIELKMKYNATREYKHGKKY